MFKPAVLSAAALALSLALPLSAMAQNNQNNPLSPNAAASGNSQTNLSSQDKQFMDQAAQANASEIRAALVAEDKAQNPTVKDFGRLMIFDHTELGADMTALADRLGVTLPVGPGQQANQQMDQLEKQQGASFDSAYMHAQVEDHEKAIALFQKEAKSSSNEVSNLAKIALPILEQHLALARLIDSSLSGQQAQASQRAKPAAGGSNARP